MSDRPVGAYTTDSRWIRDGEKRVVLFRGVNAGGRAKLPPFLPLERPEDADQIASWGANLVRFVMTWEGVEPERNRFDDAYIDRVAEQVGWLGARGVEVFLDFHQDLYSRLYCGDGAPLWASPEEDQARAGLGRPRAVGQEPGIFECDSGWFRFYTTPEVTRAFDRFWANEDGLQDHYVEAWRRTARRFADDPAVIGYEIMNEPYPGSLTALGLETEHDRMMPFFLHAAEAIRQEDPDALVFYEPAVTSTLFFQSAAQHLGLERIVLAPHFYTLAGLAGSRPYDPASDELTRGLDFVSGLASGLGIPMLLGEFGAYPGLAGGARLIRDYYTQLDTRFLSGTIWHFATSDPDWNDEGVSLVGPDRTERPYVQALVRPYARRIAGLPERMSFDPDTRAFTLRLRREAGVSGRTVIYLPAARVYPEGFDVTVSVGDVYWDETKGELLHEGGVVGETVEILVRPKGQTSIGRPRAACEGTCAVEEPEGEVECVTDGDCASAGCSGEICTSVVKSDVVSICLACEPSPKTACSGCGCIEGQCRWYK